MSIWSLELCENWTRVGQLSLSDAWHFQGVVRYLERGEWMCTFPDGAGSFTVLESFEPLDGALVETPSGSGLYEPSSSFELIERPAGSGLYLLSTTMALPEGASSIRLMEQPTSSGLYEVMVGSPVRKFTPLDVDTIRLVEDGVIRYWGYVAETTDGQGGIRRVVDQSGVHWELSGPDLWYALAGAVAFPEPSESRPEFWGVSHDERSGQASTVAAGYVNDNIGPFALTNRQRNVNAIDHTAGSQVDWSARLQPVDEVVRAVCGDGGITCHLAESEGQILASMESPRDLSASKVFSEKAQSFSQLDVRSVPPRATWVVAGGDGEGTARLFRTADDGSTGVARRERFYDISNATTAGQVQQAANADRRSGAATFSVSAELNGDVAEDEQFGRSIFVGDVVTVENRDGLRFPVPVRSVAWDVSPERQQVHPTLGEAVPDLLRGRDRDILGLAERFNRDIR